MWVIDEALLAEISKSKHERFVKVTMQKSKKVHKSETTGLSMKEKNPLSL